MRLSEICVQRPVFAFMLIMFLVVMGVFSFLDLGVDLFPRTDPATVYVSFTLPGASPEEIVSQMTMPLEEAVSSVSGIDELRAIANEGNGFIIVTFNLEKDISEATEEVREKVSGAQRMLPESARPPTVRKADPDSDPVITMALSGDRSVREITEVADKVIRRALETVNGVAQVSISGGRLRQVNLMLDINKLNAYSLTAQEIEQAVRAENIESPGGRIVTGPSEIGVRTMGRVESIEQFNNIIIKNVAGSPIRLRDVGFAEDGMAERRNFSYYQGKPAVMISVQRQIGTNTVEVVDDVQAKLAEVNSTLPGGLKLTVITETATYIKKSVESLEEHLVLGSLLASLIIWFFIRDWRTVLISSIAIPTSIITTFSFMRMLDYSLNAMTLLALTLAVGIVIDDAIIVLENIYRWLEEKPEMNPLQAAIDATKEISLAVVATTISLVIIFVPIAFTTGYAKRYLNQFGWTMAVSIMVSMLVAFTLTPTLSARILKRKSNGKSSQHGHRSGPLERGYMHMLGWSLGHRWVIVVICVITFASTVPLYRTIGRDWMPQEDQSELGLSLEMPEGSSLNATERVALELARKIEKVPGVRAVVPSSGQMGGSSRVAQAQITILLYPPNERGSLNEIAAQIRAIMLPEYAHTRPGLRFPNVLGGRDTFSPIRASLLGPDLQRLFPVARETVSKLMTRPEVADIRANLSFANPELQVKIDRQLASDLGVRVSDVASAVRLMMSGDDEISTFKDEGEQYPVTMRLMEGQRDSQEVLSRLLVPSARLGLIRLDSIAAIERGAGPSRIDRTSRQYSIGFYGNVAQGYSLDAAAAATQDVVDSLDLPAGYRLIFSGQVKILEETTINMLMAIGLASIFMYMVLAAQFESLTHPFIILLTLPLSIPFALLSLQITGRTLNLFSALGILLLLGIVKKNGILQIDCMNRLLAEGMPLREAIMEANRIRLRPILMTTFSIIAGLIPTAVAVGTGAATRSAIAVTIIGGQTLCLLLTLLVVPVGYSYIEDARAWFGRRKHHVEATASGD